MYPYVNSRPRYLHVMIPCGKTALSLPQTPPRLPNCANSSDLILNRVTCGHYQAREIINLQRLLMIQRDEATITIKCTPPPRLSARQEQLIGQWADTGSSYCLRIRFIVVVKKEHKWGKNDKRRENERVALCVLGGSVTDCECNFSTNVLCE